MSGGSVSGMPVGKTITIQAMVTDEIRLEMVLIVAAEFAAWQAFRSGKEFDQAAGNEAAQRFALDWAAGRWPR